MWLGTYGSGADLLNKNTSLFPHFNHTASTNSLSNNHVLCVFEDSDHNIWMGTEGGGLNKFNPQTQAVTRFNTNIHRNGISGNYVLSIVEDNKGDLWIGTWGGGITVMNKAGTRFRYIRANSKGNTRTTHAGNIDNVWLLKKDAEGKIWIPSDGNTLYVYDPKTDRISFYDHWPFAFNRSVNAILFDSKGIQWLGFDNGGIARFNKKLNKFIRYTHSKDPKSLSNDIVTSLLEDHSGNLWIGTYQGLNRMNKEEGTFTHYSKPEGLPGEIVYAILEDANGFLWVSTNKGLSKFNPKLKSFTNFTVEDGLQANEFIAQSAFKSSSGAFYFGGINGFNVFFPDSIKNATPSNPVYITGFKIFNKNVDISTKEHSTPLKGEISETKQMELSYKQSVFTLEFSALDYSYYMPTLYAYKMEGFDKDWNIGNKREATYTNLNPGEYKFIVKTVAKDGKLSPNEAVLKIIIIPPFWLTWWFKLLSILTVVGGVYSFFKVRFHTIRTQRDKLEALVKERTEQERKARQYAEEAHKEAEQANKAKSTFLATMSHEIRTPMNGVIGTAYLLAETNLNEEQRRYIDIIRTSGDNLLTVINDILDFSKIESEKLELEYHSFDLRSCVEDVLDLFAGKAASVRLDLMYEIGYNIPAHIYGDSGRLRQILVNLVSNAVKFTSKGEIFIGIKLKSRLNDDIVLDFEVRDTGIGIPQEKISTLFEAFIQVDSSTTRKYGGTGLGLAISKKLIALMGGQISIESQLGKGTSFHFNIEAKTSTEPIRSSVYTNITLLKNKRILIVDDNLTNIRILQDLLEKWKFIPTTAISAEIALNILKDSSFDLLITDMQMPDMDGYELAKSAKNIYPDMPIILLSSLGDSRIKKNEPFFRALAKPIRHKELYNAILSGFKQENPLVQEDGKISKEKIKVSIEFAENFPLRILIAEDNPINQTLISMVLEKLGYIFVIVDNGVKAIEALNESEYDMVLMDVQMPEMDGLEATKQIRGTLFYQPVIIGVTANAMKEDEELCLATGMDDYLSKPIQLEKLMAMLKKWSKEVSEKKHLT